MKEAVTPAQWAAACTAVAKAAAQGDVQAFKAIAPYLAGQPVQRLEFNAENDAALQRLQELAKAENCTPLEALQTLEERARMDFSGMSDDELERLIERLGE